jgi:hypothetical protein
MSVPDKTKSFGTNQTNWPETHWDAPYALLFTEKPIVGPPKQL